MANLSRRTFLRGTTVAGTSLMASTAASYRRVAAAQAGHVTVAVIGCGAWGRLLAGHIQRMDRCRLFASCDVDAQRLDQLKLDDAARRYSDLRAMIEKESSAIDAVVIATPTHWNALATKLACRLRKHVYVSAPVSHNLFETQVMMRAAQESRVIAQVGFSSRSMPERAQLLGQLREATGRVSIIRIFASFPIPRIRRVPDSEVPAYVDYDLWQGPAPVHPFNTSRFHTNWRWFRDYGTGTLGDTGAHLIDFASGVLEEPFQPVSVRGASEQVEKDTIRDFPDSQSVTFKSNSGVILNWEHRVAGKSGQQHVIEMIGERGTVQVHPRHWQMGPELQADGSPDAPVPSMEKFELPPLFDEARHLRDFFDSIRRGTASSASFEATLSANVMYHLGNVTSMMNQASSDTQVKELYFDPKGLRIVNNQELNSHLRRIEYRSPFDLERF